LRLSSAARTGISFKFMKLSRLLLHTGCCKHLAVRAQATMENSSFVCGYLNVAHQGWIAPDAERVIREATGADNLTVVVAPSKACHLRPRVNAVGPRTGCRVPEMDVSIIRSSASCKEVWLPWAPAQSLDGCLVVCLLELWSS
jgi:hypothetical protein